MKEYCFSWKRLLRVALFFGLMPGALPAASNDRVMSSGELAAMDRENAMWRQVRVAESVQANLSHLRSAGYAPHEVLSIESQLEQIWGVAAERNFGWLREDTIGEITDVDREFISRMRAARLYRATGIRAADRTVQSEATVSRLWRQALLRVLEYDEISEFRLMNSASARELDRMLQGMILSTDEQRTLFSWQRDFDATYPVQWGTVGPAWRQQAQLEHWERVREVLGDDRFLVYLDRANSNFAEMTRGLGKLDEINAREIIEVWWVRRKLELARDVEKRGRERAVLTDSARDRVAQILGAPRFSEYTSEESARWMFGPRPGVRKR